MQLVSKQNAYISDDIMLLPEVVTQLAFYVNLHRAVIGPSATLTGRWRPDIDLRRMLTGKFLWTILLNASLDCQSNYSLNASKHSGRPWWLSWLRRLTADQEVGGSTPAEVGNFLSWRLIMKYFLRSFSLQLIQGGQLSVSGEIMCTILVNPLEDLACSVNMWLGELITLDMTPLGWLGRKTSTQTKPNQALRRQTFKN